MPAPHRWLAATALGLALVAGAFEPVAAAAAHPAYTWSRTPSPIVLQPPAHDMYFRPVIFCWIAPSDDPNTSSMLCGDGFPTKDADLRTAQSSGSLRMWFGMPGWTFTARLRRLGTTHARTLTIRATPVSARRFRIPRPSRAGSYRVALTGQGPQGDEAIWFRWRVLPQS